MSGDYTMYRMFYFFLFAYATYTCLSACIRGNRRSSDDDDEEQRNNANGVARNNNNNNNEPRGTPAEEQAKRRDKVRSRLEFRKILSSSSPGKLAELGPPLEPDLESGEGNSSNAAAYDDNLDPSSLELLSEMGFTLNASRKALSAVGGSDTEAAMDWIFDHQNDPDLDNDPPGTRSSTTNNNNNNSNNNNYSSNLSPYVEQEDSKISATDSSVRSFVTASMSFLTKVGLAGNDPRNNECCSICLEAYKVGDTVARLKRTQEQLEREKKGLQQQHRVDDDGEEDHHQHHDSECNHWFHEDCILEWLQNHDECPLCRVDMVNGNGV